MQKPDIEPKPGELVDDSTFAFKLDNAYIKDVYDAMHDTVTRSVVQSRRSRFWQAVRKVIAKSGQVLHRALKGIPWVLWGRRAQQKKIALKMKRMRQLAGLENVSHGEVDQVDPYTQLVEFEKSHVDQTRLNLKRRRDFSRIANNRMQLDAIRAEPPAREALPKPDYVDDDSGGN